MGGVNRYLATRLLPPTALAVGVALALLLGRLAGMYVDSSAQTLLASDPRTLETFETLHGLLPETAMVMVALEMDDLFSDRGAGVVAEATRRMESVAGSVEVKSLTHSGRPVRDGFGLAIEAFIPPRASPEEWLRLRDFTTRHPMSRNVLVSADGRHAVLLGLYERPLETHAQRADFHQEFTKALAPLHDRVIRARVLSFPFVEVEARALLLRDLRHYLVWALALTLLILIVTFRSVAAVAYILSAELAGGLTVAAMFLVSGVPVDFHTGMVFPLAAGVQLTFLTHHVAALQRFGRDSAAPRAAANALREVLAPAGLAALTTMAGLSALGVSELPMVARFGRMSVAAVAAVFVVSFLWPLLLVIASRAQPAPHANPPARRTFRLPQLRLPVFVAFAGGTAVMLAGATRLRTDVRAVEFVPRNHPVRETLELLDRELGGINIFQLEIDTGRPRGLQRLPVLRWMEELRAHARSLDGVTDAYAYSQLYTSLNQLWEGDAAAEGTLPTAPWRLAFFSGLINQTPLLFEESFVFGDARASLFVVRSVDMPGDAYLQMIRGFLDHAEASKPEGVLLTPVRGMHTLLEANRAITRNQSRSLLVSAGIIALLLTLLWRSPLDALRVLAANVPALAVMFGVMGFAGIPLNSITVMAAAVILGIAVDDGIHLVSAIRAERKRGVGPAEAVTRALSLKLKPIACTSAILTVFLGLLATASFPPAAHFGLLSAAGMVAAFLGTVVLLTCFYARVHHQTPQGFELP